MSENVEIVRRAFAAFIEGDYERLIGLADPQIEYDVSRTSPESRVACGPQEVVEVLEEWVDTWDEHQVELSELIDAGGETVVAMMQERGKLKGSDTWVEHARGVVYTVRDQRVVRYEEHEDRAQALEAAGLRESAMSDQNAEVVRQLVGAFNRRDLAAMTQWFAPEVEWEPGGPAAVERAVYRGRDEVAGAFAATWETWEVFHVEESEVRDLGDSVVWLGSARLRGDASHVDFNQPFAVHFLVRGGKVGRFRGFVTWQEALEAAGLSK